MNPEPLVSVVIPTYNRPDYLRQALESVVQQRYQNLEIIVSDDAGDPRNHEVAMSFQDPRIHYRRNEVNLGILANNLASFRAVTGKYIADLNDDDRWGPDFLSTLVPHLEADPSIVVAFSDHYIIDANGIVDEAFTTQNTHHWWRDRIAAGVHKPFHRLALVTKSVPIVMAAVLRRDAIEWDDFPTEVGPIYDFWLNYLACRTGKGAYYSPERLTYYRSHAGSETANGRVRVCTGQIYCYGRFLEDDRLSAFKSHFKREYGRAQTGVAAALLQADQQAEAKPYALTGLRNALSFRSIAIVLLAFLPQAVLNQAVTLKSAQTN